MMRIAKLVEALDLLPPPPPPNDELDKSNKQPYHLSHMKVKTGENNTFLPKEEILLKKWQRRGGANMISTYKPEMIDLEDEDWKKKLEWIMEKNINS